MRLFNTPSLAHIVFSNCVGPAVLADKDAVHRDVARLENAANGHPRRSGRRAVLRVQGDPAEITRSG